MAPDPLKRFRGHLIFSFFSGVVECRFCRGFCEFLLQIVVKMHGECGGFVVQCMAQRAGAAGGEKCATFLRLFRSRADSLKGYGRDSVSCVVCNVRDVLPALRSCLETEGAPRICTGETDLKTGKSKSNDEIQGSFAALRRTA